jgi:hypothetical protein
MKLEGVQAGLKRRRRGSGRRRLAEGVSKATVPVHRTAPSAETRPDPERARREDSHLRSIRGAKDPKHAADRAGSKAVMRRLMQETFFRCQPQIAAALRRCFTNPKTVLDCMRLLARLNGELP